MNNRSEIITSSALVLAALVTAWQLTQTDINMPCAWHADQHAATASVSTQATLPNSSNREKPDTSTNLRWLGNIYNDGRAGIVDRVVRDFRFRHPDINLRVQSPELALGVRSRPAMARCIADMLRTGVVVWDVIWLDAQIYELVAIELNDPLWGQEHLVDFAHLPSFTAAHKPFITDDPNYRNQTGGILAGPHLEGYAGVLWWNRDVADRIGIKVKRHGMTFEDLEGYVQAVHRYNLNSNQDARPKVAAFYEAHDWTTVEVMFQNLVKSELEDFEAARQNTASDRKLAAMRKTFEAYERLAAYNPLIQSCDENIWFETREQPLRGESLFSISGTWMRAQWEKIDTQLAEAMQPAELPTFKPVSYTIGSYSSSWAVLKLAPAREAAIQLLLSCCQPKTAELWVRESKNPTGLRGDLTMSAGDGDVLSRFQRAVSQRYGSRLHYSATTGYLLGASNAHLRSHLCEQLRQVLKGKITAQTAYDRVLEECR